MKLLSHGTKFTPVTKGKYIDAKKCTENFTRRLKVKYKYHDTEFEDTSLCRNKSKKPIRIHDEEMKKILQKITNIEPAGNASIEDNLESDERNALRELQNEHNITIKEADKGGAIVIMDKDFYDEKLVLADHLLHEDTYVKVEDDADKKTMKDLIKLVDEHSECLTTAEMEFVKDPNWRSSEFYIRPKIHKCKSVLEEIEKNPQHVIDMNGAADLVGRPIIAGTHSPTRHLSDLITEILRPIVPTQTSYVKDDWDYLRKIPRNLNGKYKLFGCDIQSLYTSIPHELGLEAMEYWLERCRDLVPERFTNEFILEAIEFLLKNNNCLFNGEMYNQITGTAMGASFAAFYACLTIGYLEETKLFPRLRQEFGENDANTIAETYRRFMDDGIVFLPWHICKDKFLALLNEMHPSIVFTLEHSSKVRFMGKIVERLNFLDLSIMVEENGTTHTDVYYKPTNSHDYLHYDSFHQKHTLHNIPYCLAKRIVVFCSDDIIMNQRLSELKKLLTQCKYPENIIDKGIFNAQLQGPAPPKVEKHNILAYVHPNMSNFQFNHIIKTTSNLLKNTSSDDIKEIFKDVRFVEAVSQPKNILRSLTSTFTNIIETTPGIYAECNPNKCEICSLGYIQNCTSFTTSSGKEWTIRSHISCNDRNVLYYLECLFCNGNVTKTGKTLTTLRLRINNHRSDCFTGRTSDVFDKHCHECGAHRGVQPYFRVRAFMKLSHPGKLMVYENLLHERKYATINT